jgi:hypothetical protein
MKFFIITLVITSKIYFQIDFAHFLIKPRLILQNICITNIYKLKIRALGGNLKTVLNNVTGNIFQNF